MLISNADYTTEEEFSQNLKDSIFKYSSFKQFSLDGNVVESLFISCEFGDLDWYWGFFFSCPFVDTRFENCTFSGGCFSDCRFLNCEFIKCQFINDNLGAPCTFEDSQWFGGKVVECIGLPENAFGPHCLRSPQEAEKSYPKPAAIVAAL